MLDCVQEWVEGLPPFAEQPGTYLITAACVLCLALALKAQLYAWRQDWLMRSLPKAPGSIPFFGHALSLLSATPWDMMEQWARDNNGKLVRMQVRANAVHSRLRMASSLRAGEVQHLRLGRSLMCTIRFSTCNRSLVCPTQNADPSLPRWIMLSNRCCRVAASLCPSPRTSTTSSTSGRATT